MASVSAQLLTVLLPLLLLFAHYSVADHHSPEFSPAPAPFLRVRTAPSSSSPLADPPSDLTPHHPLSPPSPPLSAPFPSPAFSPAADPTSSAVSTSSFDLIQPEDESDLQSSVTVNENSSGSGSGGMSGGKKAAVAIAAVAGAALVGMGALIYKKRQENIGRARYGYATRRDLL